ncbi:MAG TPA: glucuronate isomerase, partial [Chthoniobacteraceae bacterium]|nr:glucuronate isomerase [Chthoniobacteraceae bacterium]
MHAAASIRETVCDVVERTPVYDIHTHLYDPAFGELLLWGIDELLVYHYLIAEGFRQFDLGYDDFWALPKTQQAEAIWNALFIEHSPISEACRGVLTALHALGLDVKQRDLAALRRHFSQWKVEDFATRCMELANVRKICMTNSPFDDIERPVWERGFTRDPRFVAALRIDPLLCDWENTVPKLRAWGYDVHSDFSGHTFDEVRRFLADWTKRIDAQYCMVSLTPDFVFPAHTPTAQL